jgi:hypothetical protein
VGSLPGLKPTSLSLHPHMGSPQLSLRGPGWERMRDTTLVSLLISILNCWIRVTPLTSSSLNYFLRDPISECSHSRG